MRAYEYGQDFEIQCIFYGKSRLHPCKRAIKTETLVTSAVIFFLFKSDHRQTVSVGKSVKKCSEDWEKRRLDNKILH